jgi:menaquinone-specific isochorismate synthase
MRAIVHRIDHELDAGALADFAMLWLHDGFALAALGQALAIDVPAGDRASAAERTADALSAIECDGDIDTYGTGPLAFAALPFATERSATIVVPEVAYGRDRGGTRWITWVGDGPPPSRDALIARLTMESRLHEHPRAFSVSAARTEQSWRASVAAVRDRLRAGDARKAVMARELDIVCDAPVARWPVIDRLRTAYASSFVFAVPCAPLGESTPWLVGATPELLVRRIGDIVRSQPMAGTTRRSTDAQTDARLAALLLASHKDRNEHQITIDTVHDTLLPWCSYLDSETEPSIVSVANVHHLATFVEGRLSKPLPSVLELVTALHPTPAVCGHPRDAARALIDEHEQMDRGSYAGAVGWVDRSGQGEWAVALRCAEIAGTRARLFAGGGIVVDSDPDAELEETRVKFETMLGAIVRP